MIVIFSQNTLILIVDLFSALDRKIFSTRWIFIIIIIFMRKNIKFLPFNNLAGIFCSIFLLNWVGLIPSFFRITVNPIFVFIIGLTLFLAPLFSSVIKSYLNFLSSLLPSGSPLALAPFLVIIELIRVLIRPVTLSIRLIANILAGHIVLGLLRISSLGRVFWTMFEFFVAGIQSYIFTLLLTTYSE